MNAPILLAAAAPTAKQAELIYIWDKATPEAKAIIVCLIVFSVVAWTVMIAKALQMRRAKKLEPILHCGIPNAEACAGCF